MNYDKNRWNCGIAVCTYNRPEYLKQCLDNLSKTPNIAELPVYVFCDGSNKETEEIISKYGFIKDVIIQPHRLGLPRHIHLIQETIFEKFGYDRLMFLEDDILISPHYYNFMNRALDYYMNVDSTIKMVNSSTHCMMTLMEKSKYRYLFVDNCSLINNYIMSIDVWRVIKPMKETYIHKFIDPLTDYMMRDHAEIMKWIEECIIASSMDYVKSDAFKKILTSSQDSVTNVIMRSNNIRYVSSFVNRIKNIGVTGVHFTKEQYDKIGYDRIVLDIMRSDADENISFELR